MGLKISKEMTKAIWYQIAENWELISEGDWIQDYKYQFITNIYLNKTDGKFYQMDISRSGSHFTDWYYSFEDDGAELVEVEKKVKKVVVESWEPV